MKINSFALVIALCCASNAGAAPDIEIVPEEDAESPETHEVVWETDPGVRYLLQTSPDLSDWTDTEGFPSEAQGQTQREAFDAKSAPKLFFRVEKLELEGFARIPAGSFSMGDSFNEDPYGDDELPVHTVFVSGFYMGRTEVAYAQWQEVYDWAVSNGYGFDNPGSGKGPNHPVHTVNWWDVVKWCNAKSERAGRTPVYREEDGSVYRTGQIDPEIRYGNDGYRLPTEAEWEKAARGGLEGERFPWGDTISHADANYRARPDDYSYDVSATEGHHPDYDDGDWPYTSPVGSFDANGYGLHDMAGNVWEWCNDWYGDYYYANSPESDPRGPASGSFRVYRGGGWYFIAFDGRAARRVGRPPGPRQRDSLGFRLARSE